MAAEVGPYVAVGGLSQVMFFLPQALAKAGNDVAIFTPKFGAMDLMESSATKWKLKDEVVGLRVPVDEQPGQDSLVCNVKSHQATKKGVKTYFLENREYYELRASVFGYKDDHVRFMLMCKGCLEWLLVQKQAGGWWPDFIHCNDWHSAYFVELARQSKRYREVLKRVPIGLTVHNFTYQGNFEFRYCEPSDRDLGNKPLYPILSPKLVKQNALMRGIKYADAVTTVSPTHAREVLTAEYAEGLEEIITEERAKMSGILNGLDTKEFDPSTDPLVINHFNKRTFTAARSKNKKELQKEFGLPCESRAFLMAYSGRLANQKGIPLIIEAMEHLMPEHPDFQLIVLGGGDDSYRRVLTELAQKYPKQIGLHLMPNFKLPRRIFSGTDVLLIPSMFEPGGIVALEALRYGAVPIVRRTGGLNDIVTEFEPESGMGNGFSFTSKNAWALYGAIIAAATTYHNPTSWKKLVSNCLAEEFSWEAAAREYSHWYLRVTETRRRGIAIKPHTAYKTALQNSESQGI